MLKRCTFECFFFGRGYIRSHSAFLMYKEKKKGNREGAGETKGYHEICFEERIFLFFFLSVPNRMRMCMGMHARNYLDALC